MPLNVDGQTYYQVAEAAQMVGVSKRTVIRWIKQGEILMWNTGTTEAGGDRRGWRLLTEQELRKIQAEVLNVAGKEVPLRSL